MRDKELYGISDSKLKYYRCRRPDECSHRKPANPETSNKAVWNILCLKQISMRIIFNSSHDSEYFLPDLQRRKCRRIPSSFAKNLMGIPTSMRNSPER